MTDEQAYVRIDFNHLSAYENKPGPSCPKPSSTLLKAARNFASTKYAHYGVDTKRGAVTRGGT